MYYIKYPDLTEQSSKSIKRQFKTMDTEINFQNLEKEMNKNIVVLYKKIANFNLDANRKSVRQKIVTGINEKNKGLTNQYIQSDISYIDIKYCYYKS